MMRVNVIGLGYIGLPTALLIADNGYSVHGTDIDKKIVDTINSGRIHIQEPDLLNLLKKNLKNKTYYSSTEIRSADIYIIAVPTPFKKEPKKDPKPNIEHIEKVCQNLIPVLKKGDLIILESTSPIGTTEYINDLISKYRLDLNQINNKLDVNIAYCPERVLPGRALEELKKNPRVIGGLSSKCSEKALEFYKSFVEGFCITTNNPKVAEMVKLVENSYRDLNIAFANQLSVIADKLDINIWEVIKIANMHPRVDILQPGPGVGGHCIAVDPWFLIYSAPELGRLSKQARITNDLKPSYIRNKVLELASQFPYKKIYCLGLTFKADVDDFRESPALKIAQKLLRKLRDRVILCDPYLNKLYPDFKNPSMETLSKSDDIVLILVDHKQYYDIKFNSKHVVDTRGLTYSEK
jgi:UDP-N-acetyl-D-mannosaminuronic acid dehydrogenase